MPNNTSLLVFMVFYFSAGETGNGTPKRFISKLGLQAEYLLEVQGNSGGSMFMEERWAKRSMEKGKVQQGGVHGHLDQ